MNGIRIWLDYGGSPALIVPRSAADHWSGIFLPTPRRSGDAPDFQLPDGRAFYIHDDSDFARPRTDYDHLCGALGAAGASVVVLVFAGRMALAVSDGNDTVAWWPARQMLLTGGRSAPPAELLSTALWTAQVELDVVDPDLLLMNASAHGGQTLLDNQEHEPVTLEPGRYRIDRALLGTMNAYRWVRLSPLTP